MLAGMMLVSMAGCGTGAQGGSDSAGTDSAQTQESTDGKSTLTIWPVVLIMYVRFLRH